MKKQALYWRLIIILISYICLGFLLNLYHVSLLIWLFTILSILYLSWAGTGAIALVIFLILLIVGFSIYIIKLDSWWHNFLFLNQYQWFYDISKFIYSIQFSFFKPTPKILIWVLSFVLIWLLGTIITFYHGMTQEKLSQNFEQKFSIFTVLTIISLIGLKIGQSLLNPN